MQVLVVLLMLLLVILLTVASPLFVVPGKLQRCH